mmetsp:Transcript_3030/g.7672  ORF Transcript_3030/g.7672 Transcript_3030/m.7672 type:complete len:379 (+) Transcript_3030:2270-3406(+)
MSARARFIPVTAQGRPKCLALTKNLRASVTSLGLVDMSMVWKESLASSNTSMKDSADDANFNPRTLARNSVSASVRSSFDSCLDSASAMAAASAADSISSISLSTSPTASSPGCDLSSSSLLLLASSRAASRAFRISSGTLHFKYASSSRIFVRYRSGLSIPMKGLFSRSVVRSCMAYLLTMTVLSCNRSMAMAVTGMMRSNGSDRLSVSSLRTLRDAALVKLVTSLVRSHRMSKREPLVLAMSTILLSPLSSSSSSSLSPADCSPTSSSSSRTKMCPIALTIALLITYGSESKWGNSRLIFARTTRGLTAASSLTNGATFLIPLALFPKFASDCDDDPPLCPEEVSNLPISRRSSVARTFVGRSLTMVQSSATNVAM